MATSSFLRTIQCLSVKDLEEWGAYKRELLSRNIIIKPAPYYDIGILSAEINEIYLEIWKKKFKMVTDEMKPTLKARKAKLKSKPSAKREDNLTD